MTRPQDNTKDTNGTKEFNLKALEQTHSDKPIRNKAHSNQCI